MACPIPLCGLSGATTIILPKSFTASTNALMPGALILSSLVIKITGFSAFVFAILQVTEIGGCHKIKGVD